LAEFVEWLEYEFDVEKTEIYEALKEAEREKFVDFGFSDDIINYLLKLYREALEGASGLKELLENLADKY